MTGRAPSYPLAERLAFLRGAWAALALEPIANGDRLRRLEAIAGAIVLQS